MRSSITIGTRGSRLAVIQADLVITDLVSTHTTIEFSLPKRGHVSIAVYNIVGQRVTTLIEEEMSAGAHTVGWDGHDASGRAVATGVYLYRFQAGEQIQTKKMLLLK